MGSRRWEEVVDSRHRNSRLLVAEVAPADSRDNNNSLALPPPRETPEKLKTRFRPGRTPVRLPKHLKTPLPLY